MSKESKAKPRELFLVTLGDTLPPACFDNKKSADECIGIIKRSNDPEIIHVIEYSALLEERAKSARLFEAANTLRNYIATRVRCACQTTLPSVKEVHPHMECTSCKLVREFDRDYNQSEGPK